MNDFREFRHHLPGRGDNRHVERAIRYTGTVDSLDDAWEFIQRHIDEVGDAPCIEIRPYWELDDATFTVPAREQRQRYTVMIEGTTQV